MIQLNFTCIVETFTITTPSSNNDYQQLASLLVETFDQPSSTSDNDSSSVEKSMLSVPQNWEKISWDLYGKFLTEQYTFQQYVQNARKMKGKKYSLFLAKEFNPGASSSGDDDVPRPYYEVVGMIELGMVLEPSMQINDQNDPNRLDLDSSQQQLLQPRAKVGVLCVNEKHANKGIGTALIQKCEDVVTNIWNQTQLFVEVEPNNQRARDFFLSCGYELCMDESNENEIIQYAKVSRRRKVEERPHFVLVKSLCPIAAKKASSASSVP